MADPIPDKIRERAVQMYLDGARTADITEELGIARSSLYHIIRGAGMRPSRLGVDLPDAVDSLQTEVDRLKVELERERKQNAKLMAIVERLTRG